MHYLGTATEPVYRAARADMFHTQCAGGGDAREYLVRCDVRPLYVPEDFLGLYNMSVANGFGESVLWFEVKVPGMIVFCLFFILSVLTLIGISGFFVLFLVRSSQKKPVRWV